MNTQKVETSLDFEKTQLNRGTKPKKLTKKFTEWFRNFLESSE
jgi:hypothetical protein